MISSSTLRDNLHKLRGLSRQERRLLFQSFLLLPVIHVALILLGFARLQRVMEALTSLKPNHRTLSEIETLPRAREITRIVSIAAGHGMYRATCLRKSLLVWWFLRGEGIQSQVCFGVRMNERTLQAHAWVEWDGIVLNDSVNVRQQYQALHEALPSTGLGL
jgi:hypothetical protein